MLLSKKLAGICVFGCLLLGLVCAGSRSAWGHALDNYGYGSRAISMGGAMVGDDSDYSAVYYNAAGMAFDKEESMNVGASFLQGFPSLKIKGKGSNPAADRSEIPTDQGISIGLATPLGGGKIGEVFSAGVGIYLPYPFLDRIIELKTFDPYEPHFVQYENANHFIQITAALSYKAWKKLAFSLGLDLLAHLNPMTVDVAMVDDQAKVNLDAKFPLETAPTAGIQYHPTDWLSLGAAYHGKTQVKIRVKANIDPSAIMPGFGSIPVVLNLTDAYKPQQVEMGFGVKPMEDLRVALAVTWVDMSDFIPPVAMVDLTEAKANPNLNIVVGLLEKYLPNYGEFKFKDYWIPRLGLEYKVTEHLDARAGYFYRNASVSAQTGKTSFIDPCVNGISAGIGINFTDPFNLISNPINVDLTYQGQFLQKVSVTKVDPADKSYTAEGSNHLISGTLMYAF
ncbi:MAG: outer membrane protein transport protein [bacterium]|nr:outer membrane protein transport protein [bacterium]